MSLQAKIADAIHGHNELAVTLSKIARGRADNGRPLAAETSRQLARDTLVALGLDWSHVLNVRDEMEPALQKLSSRRR